MKVFNSRYISRLCGLPHKYIKKAICMYLKEFKGAKSKLDRISSFVLNENQFRDLIIYIDKLTPTVRDLKMKIVKDFFKLKDELNKLECNTNE